MAANRDHRPVRTPHSDAALNEILNSNFADLPQEALELLDEGYTGEDDDDDERKGTSNVSARIAALLQSPLPDVKKLDKSYRTFIAARYRLHFDLTAYALALSLVENPYEDVVATKPEE